MVALAVSIVQGREMHGREMQRCEIALYHNEWITHIHN
jgi:hypothetical protein